MTSTVLPAYRQLLRSREYAGLLLSRLVSLMGDQVSRVALTVLVYQRTASPLLSASSYAVTYVPAVVGGPLLGGLADRLPRRRVLVGCDLVRATVFAGMAVPGLPLPALFALIFLASAVQAPWAAARAPLMRDVLADDDGYQLGTGLDEVLSHSGQVVGFAAAGLLLAVLSPTSALLLDAASFLVSALVVRLTLASRPAAGGGEPGGWNLADARTGWRAATAPSCRRPLLLTWAVLTCAIAPEALATPWAGSLGAGPRGIGLLFAAAPVGNVIGVLVVSRLPVARAQRLLAPLALASLLPLVLCALGPPLPVALALVAVSGAGSSVSLLARVAFVRGVPGAHRGRAFSVAAAGVQGVQGVGIAVAGGVASLTSPPAAVAVSGTVGLLLVALVLQGTDADPASQAAP